VERGWRRGGQRGGRRTRDGRRSRYEERERRVKIDEGFGNLSVREQEPRVIEERSRDES